MKEIYKAINGYEGTYSVSNLGNVKNTKTGLILTPKRKKVTPRYCSLAVGLYKESKQKEKIVARLVAKAFIPNLENKPFVNHKDSNPMNNSVSNLEWCTALENTRCCIDSGRFVYALKTNWDRVNDILLMSSKKIKQKDIAKKYGCSRQNISFQIKKYGKKQNPRKE